MTAYHPRRRARRIKKDAIERLSVPETAAPLAYVPGNHTSRAPQTLQVLLNPGNPLGVDVDCHQLTEPRSVFQQVPRFAPWRRTGVQHTHPRLRVEQRRR